MLSAALRPGIDGPSLGDIHRIPLQTRIEGVRRHALGEVGVGVRPPSYFPAILTPG